MSLTMKMLLMIVIGILTATQAKVRIHPGEIVKTFDYLEDKIEKWWDGESDIGSVGEPLFLTPILQQGNVKEAQEQAAVHLPEAPDVVSYSGFLTVNPKYDSNMFFWYFPAVHQPATAPLVIWLQGGPGGSSLFATFVENGPFRVNSHGHLKMHKSTWTLNHNVIYIDNPVGTGYSFTKDDLGYSRNETDVAENLLQCITQLFTMFPEFENMDLYITGESYAGKYVPAIAYRIHQANKAIEGTGVKGINLKGMAIGDGLMDPATQNDYGTLLYSIGLINKEQKKVFDDMRQTIIKQIENKQWKEAFKNFDNLLDGDLNGQPSIFTNFTGYHNYFNYLLPEAPEDLEYFGSYLAKTTTRAAMHVGNITYDEISEIVEIHLLEDIMQSVKPWIEEILNNGYRVLIYNGQLDIIIGNSLTQDFIDSLNWNGKKEFSKAPRKKWFVGSDLAGYSTSWGNFTQVLVRGAGHLVPYDQPKRALDMITRFTHGKSF